MCPRRVDVDVESHRRNSSASRNNLFSERVLWRRKALEVFPELQRELKDREEVWSAMALWALILRPLVREAHAKNDRDLLRRIYGYAAWSSRHPAKEVWNAVDVGFYEHLFEDPQSEDSIERVAEWLPEDVVRSVWPLWESGPCRLSEADLARLRKELGRRGVRR